MKIEFPENSNVLALHTAREYRSCDSSGVCDDYCRCRVITGIDIDNISKTKLFNLTKEVVKGTQLDEVLGFWFLKQNLDLITNEDNWRWNSCPGYYGEELGAVYFNSSVIDEKAEMFTSLSTSEQIRYLLTVEYGKVLPEVAKYQDWDLKQIFVDDFLPSDNTKLNPLVEKEYEQAVNVHGISFNESPFADFQNSLMMFAPLCVPRDGKYQLIDGRHRATALTCSRKFKSSDWWTPVWMWIVCPKKQKE